MTTFIVTKEMLEAKNACHEGLRNFIKHYPDGVDYQALLDACAESDKDDYAIWLFSAFGSTKTVLEVDELISEKSVFFSGSIVCKGKISAKRRIFAGRDINAGYDIKAGGGIKAGWSVEAGYGIKAGCGVEAGGGIKAGWSVEAGGGIKAGWSVEAGGDYGIYAGLCVRVSQKTEYATIKAKTEPQNIICGQFVATEDKPC